METVVKKFALKKTLPLALLGLAGVAGLAYAATYLITLQPEITLSEGSNGHKPKLIRAADGTLIAVYGEVPVEFRLPRGCSHPALDC